MIDFYMWWINVLRGLDGVRFENAIMGVGAIYIGFIVVFVWVFLSEHKKLKGKTATLWLIGIGLTLLYPFWHIVALIGFFCGLVEFINKLKKEWGFK